MAESESGLQEYLPPSDGRTDSIVSTEEYCAAAADDFPSTDRDFEGPSEKLSEEIRRVFMLFQYLTFTVGLLLRRRTPRRVLEPNDGRRRYEGFITVPGRKRLTGDKRGFADAQKAE